MHLLNVAAKYSMCIGYSLYTHPFCMLSPIPCIMFHVFGGLHVEKKTQLRSVAAQCETSCRYSAVSDSFFRCQYRVR